MVIRRVLGAAMRALPLMIVLFIPMLFAVPRLYLWARPLDSIADPAISRAPAKSIIHTARLPELPRIHHPRRHLLRHLVRAAILPHQVVLRARPSADARQQRALQNRQRSGHHPLRASPSRSRPSIGSCRIDPSWISTIYGLSSWSGQVLVGAVLRHRRRAHPVPLSSRCRFC